MPLPFVKGQSETCAPKGRKRVSIAQPFGGQKKEAVHDPTYHGPGGKLMRWAIIFPGIGKRISKGEKEPYHSRVHVVFQNKAWVDSDYCTA